MTRIKLINADYHKQAKLCLVILCCVCFAPGATSPAKNSPAKIDNCINCHIQATGRAAEVVAIHRASTHGKVGVGCGGCHGGDPLQTEKEKAHSQKFISIPDRTATLAMCGNCHQQQLAQFKTSRHSPGQSNLPRIDCAECHGAHSIGNPPESFSIIQFCAGCHGLEYLPPLPQLFQDLLMLSDQLREEMNRLSAKGLKGPQKLDEVIKQRKEIRRLAAEIVHTTDRDGGLKRIPQILSLGENLKQEIKRLR